MPSLAPRPLPNVILVFLLPIAGWFILRPFLDPVPTIPALYTSFGLSIIAFLATLYLVPALGPAFVQAKLSGKDLLKIYKDDIPESQGLVCAATYFIVLMTFLPFAFSDPHSTSRPEGIKTDFPHHKLSVYLSSLLSILVSTLLGFLDDVFDIRWRHKLPIPILGSIPLLIVYFAEGGNTHVVVPLPLRFLFGTLINLGPLYYVYMSLLSTFTTNSINILAGINGSEVSQALVIGISIILNDLLYLPWPMDFRIPLHLLGGKKDVEFGGVWSAGMAYGSQDLVERHLFSVYFMLPMVAVCMGFLYHNWYPARAFPGDTLCYVTGMAFSVVGIQAHFSKTLLLFFIPQIFNFVLSCPQLFGLIPCPRHRVPRFEKDTNLLYPSTTVLSAKPRSSLSTLAIRVLSMLGLVSLTIEPKTGEIREVTNLTLLNSLLVIFGPMNEKTLVQLLIVIQIGCNALAFIIRYGLAGLVYDGDRR